MKISTKGRYALRVMIDLAIHSKEDFVSVKDIATRQEISNKYLEQIIAMLNKAGYLETVVTIISSMAAMMTVFIVLPKIMTKYLFDVEEEKNIYNIVKQIQDYDQVIRENLR